MRFPLLRLLPLALLAACSHSHPLDGSWHEELPNDAHGMHIDFDTASANAVIGLRPRPDGTHEDTKGTYTFDAATMTVTVKARLLGDGKADTWTGKIEGADLVLSSADGKLTFGHGEHAHGH